MSNSRSAKLSSLEAQGYLAAIVDSSDDAIISKDLSGNITSWNKSAERIFGYQASEVIGSPITLLIPADHQAEEAQILARIKQGERVEHFETIRRAKDGRLVPVSITVSPIRDSAGTIIGASKIARDTTKARNLAAAQSFLASIIDSSDDAIITKDFDGIITSWNKGGERIFGYSPAEV